MINYFPKSFDSTKISGYICWTNGYISTLRFGACLPKALLPGTPTFGRNRTKEPCYQLLPAALGTVLCWGLVIPARKNGMDDKQLIINGVKVAQALIADIFATLLCGMLLPRQLQPAMLLNPINAILG